MSYAKEELANANKAYERALKNIETMIPIVDASTRVAEFWKELTGQDEKPGSSAGHAYLYVHMGRLMSNGCYPTRAKEIGLLIERIDELLDGLVPFDKFTIEVDEWTTTYRWGKYNQLFVLYASNGGNCQYKQVGTETVETPIYDVECT